MDNYINKLKTVSNAVSQINKINKGSVDIMRTGAVKHITSLIQPDNSSSSKKPIKTSKQRSRGGRRVGFARTGGAGSSVINEGGRGGNVTIYMTQPVQQRHFNPFNPDDNPLSFMMDPRQMKQVVERVIPLKPHEKELVYTKEPQKVEPMKAVEKVPQKIKVDPTADANLQIIEGVASTAGMVTTGGIIGAGNAVLKNPSFKAAKTGFTTGIKGASYGLLTGLVGGAIVGGTVLGGKYLYDKYQDSKTPAIYKPQPLIPVMTEQEKEEFRIRNLKQTMVGGISEASVDVNDDGVNETVFYPENTSVEAEIREELGAGATPTSDLTAQYEKVMGEIREELGAEAGAGAVKPTPLSSTLSGGTKGKKFGSVGAGAYVSSSSDSISDFGKKGSVQNARVVSEHGNTVASVKQKLHRLYTERSKEVKGTELRSVTRDYNQTITGLESRVSELNKLRTMPRVSPEDITMKEQSITDYISDKMKIFSIGKPSYKGTPDD